MGTVLVGRLALTDGSTTSVVTHEARGMELPPVTVRTMTDDDRRDAVQSYERGELSILASGRTADGSFWLCEYASPDPGE
jgi:hypothetical protein